MQRALTSIGLPDGEQIASDTKKVDHSMAILACTAQPDAALDFVIFLFFETSESLRLQNTCRTISPILSKTKFSFV